VQLHASEYKEPSQLKPGAVLVVGAANSGAEIAAETAAVYPTWMSGRDPGEVPFPIDRWWVQLFVVRFLFRILFHRVFTVKTPMGRAMRKKMLTGGGHGAPRIRKRRTDLDRAGVKWAARTAGVKDGFPLLADGRTLPVQNVIWCTGFSPSLGWIDLPIFDERGEPRQTSGFVEGQPGLYFVGQHFQHAMSSTMIHGVGRDAARVVSAIATRATPRRRSE
jgi:putative flavoprotein involved in K+ transport